MRFYDESTDRIYVGRIVALCIALLAAIWLVTVGIWGLGVATAGIYGRGQQVKQVNSANNRTFQYSHFFDLYNDVKSQTTQLANAKASAAAATDQAERDRLNSVVLGLQNLCTANQNQYNADAAKVRTGAQFKDASLPDRLPDGPATNCGGTP